MRVGRGLGRCCLTLLTAGAMAGVADAQSDVQRDLQDMAQAWDTRVSRHPPVGIPLAWHEHFAPVPDDPAANRMALEDAPAFRAAHPDAVAICRLVPGGYTVTNGVAPPHYALTVIGEIDADWYVPDIRVVTGGAIVYGSRMPDGQNLYLQPDYPLCYPLIE